MSKIKPEILELLKSAIERNAYEQTRGRLKQDNCFCFGGVLCDLYIEQTGKAQWVVDMAHYDDRFNRNRVTRISYGVKTTSPDVWVSKIPLWTCIIPPFVLEWAGATSQVGRDIARLNDYGASFKQIIEFLESPITDPYEFYQTLKQPKL